MFSKCFLFFISLSLLALYALLLPSIDTLDAIEDLHSSSFQNSKIEFQNESLCFYKQFDLFIHQELKAEEFKEEERKNPLEKRSHSIEMDLDNSEFISLYIEKAISSANVDTSHFQRIPLYKLQHSWKTFLIFKS